MNREDIIRMARECGLHLGGPPIEPGLERFASLVAAAEREACAQIAETCRLWDDTGEKIANAIRARGNT